MGRVIAPCVQALVSLLAFHEPSTNLPRTFHEQALVSLLAFAYVQLAEQQRRQLLIAHFLDTF